MEVSVEPEARALPRGCLESCFPRPGHCVGIDGVAQGRDRVTRGKVSLWQWHAAERVVLPRGRPAEGIDLLQGGNELSQFGSRSARIGDAVHGRGLAFEPPIYRPMPGITLSRR